MRRLLPLVVTLVALALPATAAAGSVHLQGRGTVILTGDPSGIVLARSVGAGIIVGPADLRVRCANWLLRPARCYTRRVRNGVATIRVRRPVKFLYEGEDFRIRIRTPRAYRILFTGCGRVELAGQGRYRALGGGRWMRYRGDAELALDCDARMPRRVR